MTDMTVPPVAERAAGFRNWCVLVILALLFIVSLIDRLILALLVEPLKRDLGLSDVQFGFVFGLAFSLFYVAASVPLARIADTGNRKRLIIAGVVFWSTCTLLTSLAWNFTSLALLRFGLAVGEAALLPAAMSLLTDLFPEHRRLMALTIFNAAGMAGVSFAFLLGGALVRYVEVLTSNNGMPGWEGWQIVFLFVGSPGILLAAAFAMVGREPARRGKGSNERPSGRDVLQHLRSSIVLYLGLFAGGGFALVVCQGIQAWGPTFLNRAYGMAIPEAGLGLGLAHIVAGVGGTLLLPVILRRLAAADRHNAAASVPLVASVIGAIILVAAPYLGNPSGLFVSYAVGGFMLIGAFNTIGIAMQYIAPSRMRATLTAILLMIINLFGMGLGPVLPSVFSRYFEGSVPVPLAPGLMLNASVGLAGCIICLGISWYAFRSALRNSD